MIGDSYFDLRARLGAALFSLGKVVEESGVSPGRAVLLRQMVASLRDPFLFVVAGEVNAGKSTFLNALFGEEFCETDVLPTTERIYYFKHGEESRDVQIDDSFVEHYRSNAFLRDFHIVDTPGTNSVAEGHQEITERFIPMADIVIFVFSVANPWGASTWEFIEQIYEGWLKNVVFVVQQSDLRSPQEIEAIVEHMRVTSRERLNREFPVFRSAKRALVAKTSAHSHETLLETSGFPEFEEYVSKMVVSADGIRQKLRNAMQTARVIMDEVNVKMGETGKMLENDRRILDALDREITTQYRKSNEMLENQRQDVQVEFIKARDRAAERLQRGFGVAPSMFGRGDLVERVEKQLPEEIGAAARNACTQAMLTIEQDLPPLWSRIEAGIREEFRVALSIEDEAGQPKWLRAREGFVEGIESSCRGSLLDSAAVEKMEDIVRERRFVVRLCGIGMVLAAMLSGFAFFFEVPALRYVAASLAFVMGFAILTFAARKQKALQIVFDERMERAEQSLERGLKTGFSVQMGKYYKEFLGVFEMVREFCESQRSQYQPLFDDLTNVENTLIEIEKDLEYHKRRAEVV